jgi:ferric enterobactin receptor
MKNRKHAVKIVLLIAIFIAQTRSTLAQINPGKLMLKGSVADSVTHSALALITIKLIDDKGETIRAAVTKEDGSFAFPALLPSSYHVVIVAIGYQPKTFLLDLKAHTDLGRIGLGQHLNRLKEVTVSAARSIIRLKADRIIYDLKADPESKANSVLGMMHKIPYITLDGQDNILLKGNSSFKVLINGKPSASVESNLNAILKSMPASTIESIEVITIPPSKYDGEGLAGIINIITIKKLNNGHSGSLNANESFPSGGPGIGGSFTAKNGKLGYSTFGGASILRSPTTGFTNSRETFSEVPTNLLQAGDRRSNNKTAYFGAEISYEVDSLHLISGQFNLNGGRATDLMVQASVMSGHTGIVQSYDLQNNNKGTSYSWDAAVNYQIGFKAVKNRLLTFSYQHSNNRNNRNGDVSITNPTNFNTPDYTQTDRQGFNEHTLQVDFVTPIKRVNIEAGVKGILRNSNSDFSYNILPNQYANNQNVFSAYNSYQVNLKTWNINAGVRAEETSIRADFTSTETVADQNYFNFLPSIAISKTLNDQTALNFGFSQRIRRPGINRLNPYIDRSNPNFELTGNPSLRPVLLNDIQAGFSSNKKLSLNIGLNYSFMNNLDLQVANFDAETQITRTSYANTGKSSNFGSNLSVCYPVNKLYNVSMNGNVMYLWLQGTSDGISVNNNRLMYSFSLSNGFLLNKGWSVNADLNVVSPNPTGLQGYSNGFVSTAFSVNKELIKNKLGFAARVNNPFTHYRNNITRTFGPDFNQLYTSRNYYRSVAFSMNYKFGGHNDGVNKSRRSIKNNDVAN